MTKIYHFVELYVKLYEMALQIEGVCNEEDDRYYVTKTNLLYLVYISITFLYYIINILFSIENVILFKLFQRFYLKYFRTFI